jgi:hypothetical protein
MSTTRKIAIVVVFAAFAFIGAATALPTVGLFDSTGPSVYAQNDTKMGGGNYTEKIGNMTAGMGNMTQ